MNKKILAILMALLMVLMSSVAMAAPATLEIFKKYTSNTTILPTETLEFAATCTGYVAPDGTTTIPANTPTFSGSLTNDNAKIGQEVPFTMTASADFPAAGVYTYTVTETNNYLQGAEYDNTTITFDVLVAYVANSTALKVEDIGVVKPADGAKDGLFENDYNEGGLTITKTVTGNAGNIEDEFEVTLTFATEDEKTFDDTFASVKVNGTDVAVSSNNTATFKVKHGQTYTITEIPYGTTVTVEETDELIGTADNQYQVTYNGDESLTSVDVEINAANSGTVALVNNRETSINTGVNTDSMPYIMLMAFVMMLAAAVVLKKRTVND